MTRRLLIPLLATLLLAVPAAADGPSEGRVLERLLAAYDRQGGGNTIPIEREILRLRDAGEAGVLCGHLEHPRFGATVAWALAATGGEDVVSEIVSACRAWPPQQQAMGLSTLGALPGDDAMALLRAFQADAEFPGWAAGALRGALLRRGAADVAKAVQQGLRAKDPQEVSVALAAIAECHDPAWLSALSRLARDPRALPQKVRSRFKVKTEQVAPDGSPFTRWESPELATVGELAVETANRLVSPDTPPMIAWWYELEKGSRFGFGEAAVDRLRRHARLDKKAAALRLASTSEAVDAVLREVRRTLPSAEAFHLEAIELVERRWVIEATVDEATLEATVAPDGTVDIARA